MRIIDADALIDVLTQRCCKNCDKRMGTKNGKRRMIYEIGEAPCRACDVDDMKMELDEAPTIDAEPVRHGKWIKMSDADGIYYACSECGNELTRIESFDPQFDLFPRLKSIDKTRYCSNCGAKMEE